MSCWTKYKGHLDDNKWRCLWLLFIAWALLNVKHLRTANNSIYPSASWFSNTQIYTRGPESSFSYHRFNSASFHYSQANQLPVDVTRMPSRITCLRLLDAWFGSQLTRHPSPRSRVGLGWNRPQTCGWNCPRFPFRGSQHQPHWPVVK